MTEDEVVQKVMLAEQPTRRFIDVDEVAALAAFLASDAARVDHRRVAADRRRVDGALAARTEDGAPAGPRFHSARAPRRVGRAKPRSSTRTRRSTARSGS